MDFSLMFFSGGEGQGAPAAYRFIREVAQFGDRAGFSRVWLPERHFVPFGALHPAPAVLAAHLAAVTGRIRLAAGSVVAPLHHPKRIVEDWSVVDNLSDGRVDLSLASGWLRSDFEFAPESYDERHAILARRCDEVRALWRASAAATGVSSEAPGDRVFPSPVQPELPLWVTAARNPQTFALAGRQGANVLTYLVDLGMERLANSIAIYRQARAEAGHAPEDGRVTVMLHTCVVPYGAAHREWLKDRYSRYLVVNQGLLKQSGRAGDLLTPDVVREIVDVQFERVYEKLSLMGTAEAGIDVLRALAAIGVDEVACLVDFVEDADEVLACLPALESMKAAFARRPR